MRKIYFVKFLNTGYLYRYRTVQFVAVAVAGTEAGATEIGGPEPEPQQLYREGHNWLLRSVSEQHLHFLGKEPELRLRNIYRTYTGYTLHSYNENCIKHFLLRKKLIR